MASIRNRAPWRVIVDGKDDPTGPFNSKVKADRRCVRLQQAGDTIGSACCPLCDPHQSPARRTASAARTG